MAPPKTNVRFPPNSGHADLLELDPLKAGAHAAMGQAFRRIPAWAGMTDRRSGRRRSDEPRLGLLDPATLRSQESAR